MIPRDANELVVKSGGTLPSRNHQMRYSLRAYQRPGAATGHGAESSSRIIAGSIAERCGDSLVSCVIGLEPPTGIWARHGEEIRRQLAISKEIAARMGQCVLERRGKLGSHHSSYISTRDLPQD